MSTPSISYATPDDPPLRRAVIRAVERWTGRQTIERLYRGLQDIAGARFWGAALRRLDVTLEVAGDLEAVPESGPVVFVANHPFGVVDGLALCHLVSRVRPDFRILINSALCRDERLNDYFLPVDFGGGPSARRTNVRSIRRALERLDAGGAVALFPAGGIATAPVGWGAAQELEWKPFAAKLVASAEAAAVPVCFHGQNSRLFHLASQLSTTLRLALVIREMKQQMGATLPVSVGQPLPYDRLKQAESREALTARLREATAALRSPPKPTG
jgi:putative hemolysin